MTTEIDTLAERMKSAFAKADAEIAGLNKQLDEKDELMRRAFRLFLPVKWAWDAWRKRRARR